ncbi:MAG: SUMF1/EgtB/PvdO family nonheme iron enzyme [Bacteroidota bacterium]
MKDILNFLEKIVGEPYSKYFFGAIVLIAVFKFGKEVIEFFNRRALTQHLRPFYQDYEVAKARKYFVETHCQNVAPSLKDEPKDSTTVRNRITKFFLNKGFSIKGDKAKFYLVLGGSGTGKTTFMINLCWRYMSRRWWLLKRYDIKLFPISDKRTDIEIENIKKNGQAHNTILLLDALDEDQEASEKFTERLQQILKDVQNFKEVIITCRTQFIPDEESIPGELRIPFQGPERGFHTLEKFYISPFNEKDIRKYLNKKFGFIPLWPKNWVRKKRANKIVQKSPNLVVRPMLLAYIDDLLEGGAQQYEHTHQIYEAMVDKWLDREAARVDLEKRDSFRRDLYDFSLQASKKIYLRWKEESRLYLTQEEIETMSTFSLDETEKKSRSLLNKDAKGNLKFAHKSILEYFVALNTKEDAKFFYSLSFEGWDILEEFCEQLVPYPIMVKVEGGSFMMGGKGEFGEKPIHKVTVKDFYIGKYPVTQAQWEKVMGENPSHFKGDLQRPVEQVSWEDCQQFIKKLNQQTGMNFRLPSEAEWEYAARGGKRSKGFTYAGSNQLDEVGWFWENSGDKKLSGRKNRNKITRNNCTTYPVGHKKPNELGLYDMSGNIREWCEDDWHENYKYTPDDGSAWIDQPRGQRRVFRGGSWIDENYMSQVAFRFNSDSDSRKFAIGFRVSGTDLLLFSFSLLLLVLGL